MSDTEDRHQIGINVNVIQHPGGILKMIAVRNNLLTHRTDRTLLYETDTLKGSSGAPVFNDSWEVIALHHYGAPSNERDENGNLIPREINEGIRISRIYKFLKEKAATMRVSEKHLANEALSLFEGFRSSLPSVIRGEPSHEHESEGRSLSHTAAYGARTMQKSNGMSFIVPLEITVTPPAGCYPAGSARPVSGRLSDGPRLSSAEGKKLDRDYSNRNGFDPGFVTGMDIKLDDIVAPLSDRITPLKTNHANHEAGVLKYQNFSVIMDSEHLLLSLIHI